MNKTEERQFAIEAQIEHDFVDQKRHKELLDIIQGGRHFIKALERFAKHLDPDRDSDADSDSDDDVAIIPLSARRKTPSRIPKRLARRGDANSPNPKRQRTATINLAGKKATTGHLEVDYRTVIRYDVVTGKELGRYSSRQEAAKALAELAGEPSMSDKYTDEITSVLTKMNLSYLGMHFRYADDNSVMPKFPIAPGWAIGNGGKGKPTGRRVFIPREIVQYDKITGEVIARHKTEKDCGEAIAMADGEPFSARGHVIGLRNALNPNKRQKTYRGFYFRYSDDTTSPMPTFPIKPQPSTDSRRSREVIQYDTKTGNVIGRFIGSAAAGKAIAEMHPDDDEPPDVAKRHAQKVNAVINGKTKCYRDWYFRYAEDQSPMPTFPFPEKEPPFVARPPNAEPASTPNKNTAVTTQKRGRGRPRKQQPTAEAAAATPGQTENNDGNNSSSPTKSPGSQSKGKRKVILQYDAETGSIVGRFTALRTIARSVAESTPGGDINTCALNISKIIRGKMVEFRGFHFRYEEDTTTPMPQFPIRPWVPEHLRNNNNNNNNNNSSNTTTTTNNNNNNKTALQRPNNTNNDDDSDDDDDDNNMDRKLPALPNRDDTVASATTPAAATTTTAVPNPLNAATATIPPTGSNLPVGSPPATGKHQKQPSTKNDNNSDATKKRKRKSGKGSRKKIMRVYYEPRAVLRYCPKTGRVQLRSTSIADAARSVQIVLKEEGYILQNYNRGILRVLEGKGRTFRGYYFHYEDSLKTLPKFPVGNVDQRRAVRAYNATTGLLVGEYASLKDCASALAPPGDTIEAFCKGICICARWQTQRRQFKGYHFRYVDDTETPMPSFPIPARGPSKTKPAPAPEPATDTESEADAEPATEPETEPPAETVPQTGTEPHTEPDTAQQPELQIEKPIYRSRRAVSAYDAETGRFVGDYPSLKDCAVALIPHTDAVYGKVGLAAFSKGICVVARGQTRANQYRGHYFRYMDDTTTPMPTFPVQPLWKPVQHPWQP